MTTKVVFAANNGSLGAEPWITDGTQGGTVLLSDVLAGSGTSSPSGFFDLGNGHMLFGASNGSQGRELWITDGTVAGTSMVRDIRTMQQNAAGAPGASYPSGFFQTSPGHALFSANDGSDGVELWVTDGTTGGTSQVADINPGTFVSGGLTLGNSSSPGNFVATSGGRTLFTATNASTGNELWVTDGTTVGTSLLADINPGTASSSPQNFLRLPNGNLLFSAISGTIGRELWVTDGTAAGTSLVKDVVPGSGSGFGYGTLSNSLDLGNGKRIFGAYAGGGSGEPWVTDGTTAGTYQLMDIRPGSANSAPGGFTAVGGGRALFSANDGVHGSELWTTDGTSAGTSLLADLNPGGTTSSSGPSGFAVVPGGKVVFGATGAGTVGRELWVTDMTSGGTSQLFDLFPGTVTRYGSIYANSGSPTIVGKLADGRQLMTAADAVHGRELWVTDGTVAGTSMVKDINPLTTFSSSGPALPASSNPASFVALGGGRFAFTANDGVTGTEVWTTDGTAAGTQLANDINVINASSGASAPTQGRGFVAIGGGKFTIVANDGISGNELWVTDLTAAGTSLLHDINPGNNGSGPGMGGVLALGDGRAIFDALDAGATGRELWITDGTFAGTSLLKDINPLPNRSSVPASRLLVAPGKALLTADDGTTGAELWVTDGTAAGTSLLKDINPGSAASNPSTFVAFNGGALFAAKTASQGSTLWFTDGTAAGTTFVADTDPTPPSNYGGSYVGNLTSVGSRAVFSDSDGITGTELWVTDGTGAGTSLLSDINPGAASGGPRSFTALGNGRAIFHANDGVHGQELWVTDGTSGGTSLLMDVNPGAPGSGYSSSTAVIGGGKALFTATGAGYTSQLWMTDGTTAGTTVVTNAQASYLTPVGNGLVVFTGTTNANGTELWVTDGTAAGTSLLRDFVPGTTSSFPTNLRPTGEGHVLFDETDPATGREIWITDGTAAGTHMVADINTTTASSSPSTLTLFQTNDAPVAHGIADQTTNEDSPFAFAVPAGAFTDPNPWDAVLGYSATLNGGGALPAWLSFNAATQSFSGTPDDPDVGTISISVTAADSFGKTATNVFGLTVVNVNDPPVIAGTVAGQTTNDNASLNPLSAIAVTDQDAGAIETVTLTLTDTGMNPTDANGVLSGAGLIKSGVGTYTLAAGSPAAVTAALDAVMFTPMANQVAPGQTVTTGINVAVNDGTGTISDATTSIVTTSINDAPVITVSGSGHVANNSAPIALFAGVAITDPDFGAQDSLSITLRNTGGSATDANGTLVGAGLIKTGPGTYTLAATSPAALTQELRALLFTPAHVNGNGSLAGGVTLTASDGIASTVFSGFNLVVQGNGNATITGAPGGYSMIDLGNGNAQIVLNGGYNAVVAGNGNTTITGAPGGFTSVTLGNGNHSIALGGGSNSIVAGNGNNTITGSPDGMTNVTLGNGDNTIQIGGTGDIITLGNGNNMVTGTQGMAFITSGDGNDTIVTGGSFNTINAGGGKNAITGGVGNDRFIMPTAGHGFDTINGFSELNGDVLDLHAAMAATSWNGLQAMLGNYLKVTASGGDTTLSIASSGNGQGTAIATLKGAGNLGLNDLLAHNSLAL